MAEEARNRISTQMVRRIPFDVRKIHPDGGGEFINDLFLKHIAKAMPDAKIMRSRPGRPNDNCRVEQKNRICRPTQFQPGILKRITSRRNRFQSDIGVLAFDQWGLKVSRYGVLLN